MKHAVCLSLAVLLLLMAGCNSNQVITSLELAIDAVSATLPLIGPSAGLPPDLQADIQRYLGATSDAVDQAAVILNGPGTDATNMSHLVGTVYDSMVTQWANSKLLNPGKDPGPKPTVKDAHDAVMSAGENFRGSSIPGIQGPPFGMVPSYGGGGGAAGPM